MRDNITKEFLYQEYVTNNKSAIQIALELGYKSAGPIHRKLIQYNIPKKNNKYRSITKELLEDLYIKQNLSTEAICKQLNIKSHTTILIYLRKFNVPIRKSRTIGQRNKVYLKGYKDISGSVLCVIKNRAKYRNLEYNLDADYLWNLYQKQNKKCAISGISIKFAPNTGLYLKSQQTASLDRIDSSKGYIKGNVQWLHKTINKMKQDLSQEEFIQYCKIISENNK